MSAKDVTAMIQNQGQMISSDLDNSALRTIKEVEAAMIIAKKFPRNEDTAIEKITRACRRRTLAESALYQYNRGDTQVEGASIRLAEQIITAWGNCQYGVQEIFTDSEKKETTYEAFAWDVENNIRVSKKFTVKHARYTKADRLKWVEDPRDVYEVVMSHGARRLRSCILAIVPEDIVEMAVEVCKETLIKSAGDVPKEKRIAAMVEAFKAYNVTKSMIEKKYQCNVDSLSELLLVKLRSIFQSLKDGYGTVESFFEVETPQQSSGAAGINNLIGNAR